MTKQEYINQIKSMLMDTDEEFRNDILNDFDEHFEQGKMKGRSEEEIAESLGDVSELIEELKTEQKNRQKKEESKNTSDNEFERIEIHGLSADVYVSPAQSKELNYVLTDRSARVNIHNYIVEERVSGKTLIIEVKQKEHRLFNFDFANLVLEVQLPASLSFASIQSVSGDVEAQALFIPKIEMKSTSGSLSIQQCSGAIQATTLSGEIEVRHVTEAKLSLNSTSGDINVHAANLTMLTATTMSGDVDAYCEHAQMVKLGSVSGDVKFNGAAVNLACSSKSGDVDAHCFHAEAVKLESISGDIDLCVPDSTGMQCVLKTISGDVDIDLAQPYQYRKNYLVFGDEGCAISLKTISGDIAIKD